MAAPTKLYAPTPRVSPISSGISMRRLPEPTLNAVRARAALARGAPRRPPTGAHHARPFSFPQIIAACHHYEEKTGGQHDAKSLAVRCVARAPPPLRPSRAAPF